MIRVQTALWLLAGGTVLSASVVGVAQLTGSTSSPNTGTASSSNGSTSATTNSSINGSGNGNGNGGSTGGGPSGHSILLTGAVVGQPAPGRTAALNVTIDNAQNQAIIVRTVTASVSSVTSGSLAGKPQCRPSWYQISSLTNGSQRIAQGAKGTVPLTITFVDDPKTNQDNCKGATYNFTFTASADQA